jgi:hypothetical protein
MIALFAAVLLGAPVGADTLRVPLDSVAPLEVMSPGHRVETTHIGLRRAASAAEGVGLRWSPDTICANSCAGIAEIAADTGRRKSVAYSDGYARRVTIHRWLSFAMLPLFATSYITGDRVIRDGGCDGRPRAPDWACNIHPVAAWTTAGVFGVNTITGGWNLWEGRKDPEGRTRRFLHAAAFVVANAGFVYAGSLGDEASEDRDVRNRHRTVALSSMGLSTASWLLMLITNR